MVSWVVKVLETTMTRVSSGSMSAVVKANSAPSTLATKRRSICGFTGRRASHSRRGPRSLPPMPMCRIALKGLPVAPLIAPERTARAKAFIRWRTASTSAMTG